MKTKPSPSIVQKLNSSERIVGSIPEGVRQRFASSEEREFAQSGIP
jgi:hypothetical protein